MILEFVVIIGAMVVVLTEFLSAIHHVDTMGVGIGWVLFLLVIIFFVSLRAKHSNDTNHSPNKATGNIDTNFPLTAKIFMAGVIFIFMVLALVALGHAPNTWDAMTYHLSRVEHWVQNKTIAYYPANITRQDDYPPLAEWGLLHLRLLTGGRHLAGLVQWGSMVVSTIGVALIARWLGAGLTGQSLAALLSACLPMGILQATSTQNDYVVTMWLVLFVFFILNIIKGQGNLSILFAGISLGLAILTKGYAYLYALPFLTWLLFSRTAGSRPRRLGIVIVIIVIALLLNAGYFYRNWCAFGSVLCSQEQLMSGKLSLSLWLSNVMRNSTLHLGTIFLPWNGWVTNRLQDFAAFLHIDLDPAQGTFGARKFELTTLMFNEDYAGNLLGVLIFMAALILAAIQFFRGRRGLQWAYFWAVGGMFFLLCLFLRFQPFNSRFHLSIFVLGSAWTAFIFEKWLPSKALLGLGLLVLAASIPWFILNHNKPLFSGLGFSGDRRMEEYFSPDPSWEKPMAGLAGRLKGLGCKNIGLISSEDSKEYLLWMVLRWCKIPPTRLEHVDVTNPTGKLSYPLGEFDPCAVVLLSEERPSMVILPSGIYGRVWTFENQQGNTKSALYVPAN